MEGLSMGRGHPLEVPRAETCRDVDSQWKHVSVGRHWYLGSDCFPGEVTWLANRCVLKANFHSTNKAVHLLGGVADLE